MKYHFCSIGLSLEGNDFPEALKEYMSEYISESISHLNQF